MEFSIALDRIDRQLLHALRIDGRAPFARLGEVLAVSDQTIARRYRRLREAGIARVVAVPGERAPGQSWLMRIQVRPGAAERVAGAIARRRDASWVSIVAGGAEVLCESHPASSEQADALLLERLPATELVTSVSAQTVLHTFPDQGGPERAGFADPLTSAQERALRAAREGADLSGPPSGRPEDADLLGVLARDARASYAQLGAAAGISSARAGRRVSSLRAGGIVRVELEITVAAVGLPTRAWLWMRVPPSELHHVGDEISRLPETAYVAAVTGPTNLVAVAVCRDLGALYEHLTDGVGAFASVGDVEVATVMRQVKQERSVADAGRLPRPGSVDLPPAVTPGSR